MTVPKLLTDDQMQRFIAHGYLCLRTELPDAFHRGIWNRFNALIGDGADLNPGNNLLPSVPELNEVFADPIVRGALTSVVGPHYAMHPHRALHNNLPGSDAQRVHRDSYWGYLRRVRNHRGRWAMIMYVPQATPLERGPTGVIPGSQYQAQRPDEALMPEVAGCLETGGFLLIHYDIWHRKMKNFTQDRRFMMKFEFVRMTEPNSPSWNHADAEWRLNDLPGLDLSAVWRRQWNWLRGAPGQDEAIDRFDAADLADRDPSKRLAAVNLMARNGAAVRDNLSELAALLRAPLEPVAVDAAYAMASAGSDAVELLLDAIRDDAEDDTDPERGPDDGSRASVGIPARSAAYGLCEIGVPSVPGLLDILANGIGSRSRKLAAFALGEIVGTGALVTDALCRATADAAAAVRINAVEALGLKPATPRSIAALSRAITDSDAQVRFSAALSLAQIGPAAEAAVPALQDALHDENRYVPGYAVEALERIGTPEAMRALLPFLKAARWCPHTSPASIY
jgi:HEAT repeat protein